MLRYYKKSFINKQSGQTMYTVRLTPYSTLDEDSVSEYSIHNANVNRQELRTGFSALNQAISNFVLNGNNIIIDDLGVFSTSVRTGKWDSVNNKWVSGGSDSLDGVDSANIRTLSIRFSPCTSLRALMKQAKFAEISADSDALGNTKAGKRAKS